MAPQKRKKGDMSSSPESRKIEPISQKQTVGEGVTNGESIASPINNGSSSKHVTTKPGNLSSAQNSPEINPFIFDDRGASGPSVTSRSSSKSNFQTDSAGRPVATSGTRAISMPSNSNELAGPQYSTASRSSSKSRALVCNLSAVADTKGPKMTMQSIPTLNSSTTIPPTASNTPIHHVLAPEHPIDTTHNSTNFGADSSALSSPSMTPSGSRETTPEAYTRANEQRHAQLSALRNSSATGDRYSRLDSDLSRHTVRADGSIVGRDAFQIAGQRYAEGRASEAGNRRQNRLPDEYRPHGVTEMDVMGMEIGSMSSTSPVYPPNGQQPLGRSHYSRTVQESSTGLGESYFPGRPQPPGGQIFLSTGDGSSPNGGQQLNGVPGSSDIRPFRTAVSNTGNSCSSQNQNKEQTSQHKNNKIGVSGAHHPMGLQKNQGGRNPGYAAIRSEDSRRQWGESKRRIPNGFFSEKDDLLTSTNKALTIGENIVNGASATIQQVRDWVPFDNDGNPLHIEEVIQEQHAIIETLLRMGLPLVDTTIDVLQRNRYLNSMVASLKERETVWKKEKGEYQRELRNTLDWAPIDPLMADSNNFDDGGEAEVPYEFTLSDDDNIMPVSAQWNTQRSGGAYTMKADYPYLRKFYPKLLGAPQPIPTDEEILDIIKPYEGNPEMTLVKIKRYYNDVRMKREYKIRELIKCGQWAKLAKDWGIGKEESPKIQTAPRGAYELLRKEQVQGSSSPTTSAAPDMQMPNSGRCLSITTATNVPHPTRANSSTAIEDGDGPERLIDYFSTEAHNNKVSTVMPAAHGTATSQTITSGLATSVAADTVNMETDSIIVSDEPKRKATTRFPKTRKSA